MCQPVLQVCECDVVRAQLCNGQCWKTLAILGTSGGIEVTFGRFGVSGTVREAKMFRMWCEAQDRRRIVGKQPPRILAALQAEFEQSEKPLASAIWGLGSGV